MAVFSNCPACMGGNHDGHVEHWGVLPPGVLDGDFCSCVGDCAKRSREAFDRLWSAMEEVDNFAVGDAVVKLNGYPFESVVVAIFDKLDGQQRVVCESTVIPGLLHIFSPEQLGRADL